MSFKDFKEQLLDTLEFLVSLLVFPMFLLLLIVLLLIIFGGK